MEEYFMKKQSMLRRALGLGGCAFLLAGMLTGFRVNTPGILSLSASAETVKADEYCRVTADSLNVRSGAGISCPISGGLRSGALVQVLETKGDWARIREGWVHTKYLRSADSVYVENSGGTGYVTADILNVRTGPGVNYAVCGRAMNGYKLNILRTENGWGKTDDGWVMLKYVSRSPTAPAPSYGGITADSAGTVTAENLNIRQGPGTNYAKVGSLPRGTSLTIQEVKNGWGRIHDGWISLSYVRSGGTQSSRPADYGDTAEITADTLHVRKGPGANYQSCGMMTRGYRTTVQEIRNGWGLVDGGWISLDYVRWIR